MFLVRQVKTFIFDHIIVTVTRFSRLCYTRSCMCDTAFRVRCSTGISGVVLLQTVVSG